MYLIAQKPVFKVYEDKRKVRVISVNTDFTRGREERRFRYLIGLKAMSMPYGLKVSYVTVY